jgi:hypothetical protein
MLKSDQSDLEPSMLHRDDGNWISPVCPVLSAKISFATDVSPASPNNGQVWRDGVLS